MDKITPSTIAELEEYLKQYNLEATITKFNLKSEIADIARYGIMDIDNACSITITLNCTEQEKE